MRIILLVLVLLQRKQLKPSDHVVSLVNASRNEIILQVEQPIKQYRNTWFKRLWLKKIKNTSLPRPGA